MKQTQDSDPKIQTSSRAKLRKCDIIWRDRAAGRSHAAAEVAMLLKEQIPSADLFPEDIYSRKVSLEHRRNYAQFFTPLPVAKLMARWLLGHRHLETVLEPAFGLGIFSRELLSHRPQLRIRGFELDEAMRAEAIPCFNGKESVEILPGDYLFQDWDSRYDGIICNPPYFKFQDYDNKEALREVSGHLTAPLSGFTNAYALFLLKSIHQLKPGGRLAYLIPSEFLNTGYGTAVKEALIKSGVLRHVLVFPFQQKVFRDALTTACIVLAEKGETSGPVQFINLEHPVDWERLGSVPASGEGFPGGQWFAPDGLDPRVKWRKFYQPGQTSQYRDLVPFSKLARVARGIATGANEFFTFTVSKASEHDIEATALLPCLCKATDAKKSFFTKEDWLRLAQSDRPAYLLRAEGEGGNRVREYLAQGEREGIHRRHLTSHRRPWYALEKRAPAPIWVSVFQRTGLRFVRNEAGIHQLTTFHGVYPHNTDPEEVDVLFACLLTPMVREILSDNRREYGRGLQKFEPNDLNHALLPDITLLSTEEKQLVLGMVQEFRSGRVESLNRLDEFFRGRYGV